MQKFHMPNKNKNISQVEHTHLCNACGQLRASSIVTQQRASSEQRVPLVLARACSIAVKARASDAHIHSKLRKMASTSTCRRAALAIAVVTALVAVLMGVLPAAKPEWFVPGDQLDAVTRFFQSTSTSAPDITRMNTSGNARATTHTNNWAVLVGTSKFWFNYRVRVV